MNLGSRSKTYQFELISLTVIGQKTKKKDLAETFI